MRWLYVSNINKYNVGNIVEGIVSGIEDYGIFVTFGNDFTGLIHISEIDNKFIGDIHDYVKVGEKIYCLIIGEDECRKHLKLSIKNINYDKADRCSIESVSGFLPLAKKLPKWIDDYKINDSKK